MLKIFSIKLLFLNFCLFFCQPAVAMQREDLIKHFKSRYNRARWTDKIYKKYKSRVSEEAQESITKENRSIFREGSKYLLDIFLSHEEFCPTSSTYKETLDEFERCARIFIRYKNANPNLSLDQFDSLLVKIMAEINDILEYLEEISKEKLDDFIKTLESKDLSKRLFDDETREEIAEVVKTKLEILSEDSKINLFSAEESFNCAYDFAEFFLTDFIQNSFDLLCGQKSLFSTSLKVNPKAILKDLIGFVGKLLWMKITGEWCEEEFVDKSENFIPLKIQSIEETVFFVKFEPSGKFESIIQLTN